MVEQGHRGASTAYNGVAVADTPVETFTRFGTIVTSMNDAFVFVMEYMEKAGPTPSVEITSCENDDGDFQHYHVAVFGVVNQSTHKPI